LPGGQQATTKQKALQKLYRYLTNENTPIHICAKLSLLADLQQKVGKLVLSITSSPTIVILENALN
jgi:hypothetical protein